MTDSMNFGPDWIRNLSSEGTTGGGTGTGSRYQLADYRYGREEMLALFDKNVKPPASLTNFKCLYSEMTLSPLALIPATDEDRGWQTRPGGLSGPGRGRGGSLERGRISRGRGGYTSYGRPAGYEPGWGNGEQSEWSPRKEYNTRTMSMENWRRNRNSEEEDGWRSGSQGRAIHDKWGRSTSWREDGEGEERTGPPVNRGRWYDSRGPPTRRSLDSDDHLPEWAMENPTERGGTFDERGAFHGSDDEQNEGGKGMNKQREPGGLQKSTSQQHIKTQPNQLTSSKSAVSLLKSDDMKKDEFLRELNDEPKITKENGTTERKQSIPKIPEKILEPEDKPRVERQSKLPDKVVNCNGPVQEAIINKDDEDFDRLQEDLVLKLVVDEEPPKPTSNPPNNFDVGGVQPPPNLAPPLQEKWFYQDPQGDLQGPFVNVEMAEWYKAGYFSHQLKVRRQCDERFFLLGELINMSGGANPFQTGIRFPILKNDVNKDPDRIQLQYYSQLAAFKQAQAARVLTEPWNALTIQQQQELAAQRLLLQQQQQQQVPQDLPFLPPQTSTNPLMHMINQMQQANKLPTVQGLVDKSGNSIPNAIDPQLQMHAMGTMLMQNRLQQSGIPNHLPGGLPTNIPGSLPPGGLSVSLPGLQSSTINSGGIPIPAMQNNIPSNIPMNLTATAGRTPSSVDQLQSNPDDPISNLLKQLQQKEQSQKIDSLWQQSFLASNTPPGGQQNQSVGQNWQPQGANDAPISMWDVQQTNVSPTMNVQSENILSSSPDKQMLKNDNKIKDEITPKELKRKKELEEKQAKKDAEEKRKSEQRKQEAEKRSADEKKKKEEERIQKELEKVKKIAEEKRMKELEEKRKLKEQRKIEEENKKKLEEIKRQEEERHKREMKELEEKRQAEEKKLIQEQIRMSKAAPWSQSNSTLGMSLADIQKAEREKRAQEVLQMQQRLQQQQEMQQNHQEKPAGGLQLNWAKKPVEPRKVKSLAEIQAEEQERLAKQAAEARLQKEKEVPPVVSSGNIWSSQSLTWANPTPNSSSQWSSGNATGFWDESSQKQQQSSKPSTVSKSNSTTNAVSTTVKIQQQVQQQQKQPKGKTKKEETTSSTTATKTNHNNNNNGPNNDEFTTWCYKTLANISTNVDIPTFVTFLRDIESAFDVKEYCKEYLGESTATQQFANNFVEKRRSYKSKNSHKDDSSTTAPTVTPYLQHSTEFQEVKGKNKKNKKSKMLKVDSRILGFNVTSAPDRINVGDRDYGDNS